MWREHVQQPKEAGIAEANRYELNQRAQAMADTRRRITRATVELHQTLGPARTSVSEIARRAGVDRVTVYRHFPDDAALFAACSTDFRARNPLPDTAGWSKLADPRQRLRRGLRDLYGYYEQTEPMLANVIRDAEHMPALRAAGARAGNGSPRPSSSSPAAGRATRARSATRSRSRSIFTPGKYSCDSGA